MLASPLRIGYHNKAFVPNLNMAGAWEFLGQVQWASGASLPVLITSGKRHVMVRIFIRAIASNGIPRLQLGSGGVDTGTHFATTLLENGSLDQTSVSTNGCPLYKTAQTSSVFSMIHIYNFSAYAKRIVGTTCFGSITSGTAPDLCSFSSIWNSVAQAGSFSVSNYDDLTTTSVSSNAFTTAAELTVWGRDND